MADDEVLVNEEAIDSLLDDTFAVEAQTEVADEQDSPSASVTGETTEWDDGRADEGSEYSSVYDGQIYAEAPSDQPSDPQVDALTQLSEIIQQSVRQQVAPMAAYIEEQRIREQKNNTNQAYEQFLSELDDMHPTDAMAKKLELVSNIAGRLVNEKLQNEQRQKMDVAYRDAFQFIAQGGRVVSGQNGQFQKVDRATEPLTASELEVLSYIKESPRAMQEAADQMIKARADKTQAARQQMAERRRASGEGAVTSGGQRAGVPKAAEPSNIDELLDLTYASNPFLWGGGSSSKKKK